MTTGLLDVTHNIGGGLFQALVQYATEDDTGKDVADAQYERCVADDLPGTSSSLTFVNALDGEEANIRGQDDGSLYKCVFSGFCLVDEEDTYRDHRTSPILSKISDEVTPNVIINFAVQVDDAQAFYIVLWCEKEQPANDFEPQWTSCI